MPLGDMKLAAWIGPVSEPRRERFEQVLRKMPEAIAGGVTQFFVQVFSWRQGLKAYAPESTDNLTIFRRIWDMAGTGGCKRILLRNAWSNTDDGDGPRLADPVFWAELNARVQAEACALGADKTAWYLEPHGPMRDNGWLPQQLTLQAADAIKNTIAYCNPRPDYLWTAARTTVGPDATLIQRGWPFAWACPHAVILTPATMRARTIREVRENYDRESVPNGTWLMFVHPSAIHNRLPKDMDPMRTCLKEIVDMDWPEISKKHAVDTILFFTDPHECPVAGVSYQAELLKLLEHVREL